jgi:hypothetical protein
LATSTVTTRRRTGRDIWQGKGPALWPEGIALRLDRLDITP